MNTKSLLVAMAAVAAATTATVEPSFARVDSRQAESTQLSRGEARQVLVRYFENRGYKVRLRRPYVRNSIMYAQVYTSSGNALGTYRVDLRTGRVRRVR